MKKTNYLKMTCIFWVEFGFAWYIVIKSTELKIHIKAFTILFFRALNILCGFTVFLVTFLVSSISKAFSKIDF
jgi:hypothetical protein